MNLKKINKMFNQLDSTIDISGNLTTYEQKAYMACLAMAWKHLETDYQSATFETSVREFSQIMEIGGISINIGNLRKALEKINGTQVKYNISGKTGGKTVKRYGGFVLISDFQVEEFDNESKVRFSLPRHVHCGITKRIKEGRIKEGKNEVFTNEEIIYRDTYTYTKRDIERVMSLDSSGIKLDGWIEKWGASKDIPPIGLDDLKMILGVEGKYKGRYSGLKERVIEPSVKDLTEKSDKIVTYEEIRTGENIYGIKNPRGWVKGIQFRYKMKPKNKIPMIGEISNVYGLIELFPKHVQKYKTLPKILEGSIKKYGVDFTRIQCEYVVGHSKKAYINFLKTMINDETYDDYLVWKEEEEKKNKPVIKDTTIDTTMEENKEKTIDVNEVYDSKIKGRMKELSELLNLKIGTPEMGAILGELTVLSSIDAKKVMTEKEKENVDKIIINFDNGSKLEINRGDRTKEKRNKIVHNEENKIIRDIDLPKEKNLSDYTENEIQAAMKKCVEKEEISMGHLKKLNKKVLLLTIKDYL